MKYVYIAGPYTKGNVNDNVRNAVMTGDLAKQCGWVPFVPHLYHQWDMFSPHDYKYWMDLCFAWVVKCDLVIRLPGESSGADAECALARSKGIAVFESDGTALQICKLLKGTASDGP